MFRLKENINGCYLPFDTTVTVKENDEAFVFSFFAENSRFYCPFSNYNEDHWMGDVCEIFIGSKSTPERYYEIEVSPENAIFVAKVTNHGVGNFELEMVPENNLVKTKAWKEGDDYFVEIALIKSAFGVSAEDVEFNALRVETDGGVPNKYLFALSPTLCDTFHKREAFVPLKDYIEE